MSDPGENEHHIHVQQLESRGRWFSPPPASAVVGGAASRPPGAGSRPNVTLQQTNISVISIQTGCVVMSDPRRREEQHRALAEEEWLQGSRRASLAASVLRLYLIRDEEVSDRPVTRPARSSFFPALFFLLTHPHTF